MQAADLDLLQARRHAAVLAGHRMAAGLAALASLSGEQMPRGVRGVEREWRQRRPSDGSRAAMVDCALDLPGNPSLAQACQRARIDGGCPADERALVAGELAAALTVERALCIALVCARYLDRYTWDATLRTDEIVAASAWDCFWRQPAGPAARPEI